MVFLIVIFGISLLVLVHELGHFLAAKIFGLYVEEFGFGFPPRLFSVKIGETIYSVNLLLLGGFVKIYGENQEEKSRTDISSSRSFLFLKSWKKIIVLCAGVFMNFLLGWFIISGIFMIGIPQSLVITDIAENSPAALVGIQLSDQIIDFKKTDDFINFIQENKGREITLNFLSNGKKKSVNIIPRVDSPQGEGALGIAFMEAGLEKNSFLTSIWEGLKTSFDIIRDIFAALGRLFIGIFTQGRILENFVGPIGILGVASQTASLGLIYFFQLLGLISLNLFVLNIAPFPALDGGRLLFLFIEKIKGSPLSSNFERTANAFGFLLLIFLMIAITIRDVIYLF